jgi:hypothetical protein
MAAELQSLGWTEGKNLSVEARSADAKVDRLPAFALDLASCGHAEIQKQHSRITRHSRRKTFQYPVVDPAL